MSAYSKQVWEPAGGNHLREADGSRGTSDLGSARFPQQWTTSRRPSREGLISLGAGGEITAADESAHLLFGYARWRFMALRAHQLFDEASFRRLRACREANETSIGPWGAQRLEFMIARKSDGTAFETEVHLLTGADGHTGAEALVMIRDNGEATGRKKLEGRLGEKAVYGQICCELVHDLNNMLELVIGNMHLASSRISDSKSREFLATAEDACWHGARLVNSILRSARAENTELEVVSLNRYITDLWPLIEATTGRFTKASVSLCDEDLKVLVDRTALNSAILNLVVNAKHALARSRAGKIRIEIKSIEDQEIDTARTADRYAGIYVVDDGPGIPASILPHLFDPYFTTDRSGKGSGLGLPMVKRFAEAHGGSVTVTSAPGQGARIGIFLPLFHEA